MKNELERMKKVRGGEKVDHTKKASAMIHYWEDVDTSSWCSLSR